MNLFLKKSLKRRTCGQAILEYIIIVAIIAVGALTVIGLFGDRIKQLFSGATAELGGKETTVNEGSSKESLQNATSSGLGDD